MNHNSKNPLDNFDIPTLKALHDTIYFVNKTGTRSRSAKILSTNILLNALGIKLTFSELDKLWDYFS
jgi:hypothetical protein